jgi:hypothetical protein
MNNEKYARLAKDEVFDPKSDVSLIDPSDFTHNKENDIEGNENSMEDETKVSKFHSFPWKNKHAFLPLGQDDDNDDKDYYDDNVDIEKPQKTIANNTPNISEESTWKSPSISRHGSRSEFSMNHNNNTNHENILNKHEDVEDDEDDEDFSRYQWIISGPSFQERTWEDSISLEEALLVRGQIPWSLLHQAYVRTQAETRQKRVEQLLSTTRTSERWMISLSSWCDIYDRGLGLLLLLTALVWAMGMLFHQPTWTILGSIFLTLRLLTKPLYWYFRGRHLARRRKVVMQIYEEVNQLSMELTAYRESPSNNKVEPETPEPI